MSIWSCACHNGMTGAGSDRDAGPTPVQRARFRGECSRERRRVRIYWRRLECTRCTPGRQQRERLRHAETDVSLRLTLRCLHQLFPLRHGKMAWRSMSPPHTGSPKGRSCRRVRHGARRMHRSAAGLQSMHHATTHEGLIETCRRLTDHAEDPSRTARENGQKARFPGTAHGRNTREPRLCRDLQGTRWE
jgi:hypothetical protein